MNEGDSNNLQATKKVRIAYMKKEYDGINIAKHINIVRVVSGKQW